MYLRFVTAALNENSGFREGVFQAAYRLRATGYLPEADEAELTALIDWFELHLTVPERFNRTTSKGYYWRNARGIAWLKDTADRHIRQVRRLANILDRHEILVELVKTDRPGYIIFEDRHQVIAEPFRETDIG